MAAGHRADFERERERSDKLMTNTTILAAVAMSARAKAARLESELTARRFRFWLTRSEQRQTPPARQAPTNELPRPKVATMQLKKLGREHQLSRKRTFAEIAALMVFAGLITVFVEHGIPFLVRQ
jgi:hypothetical protein